MISLPTLTQSHVRDELKLVLSELETEDPLTLWQGERQRGLASGIDEVFHFFFDDHDFDTSAIGSTLLNEAEVQSIEAVKLNLEAILDAVGDAEDDDFVSHPLWANVRQSAAASLSRLKDKG